MKFLFILLAYSLSALSFTPSSPQTCTPLDLRHPLLGEVKNQGKISWCYAFTASDQLAYTFGVKEKISASDIALNYNDTLVGRIMDGLTNNGNPHETGFNKAALMETMKEGYCPENVLPSEVWTKVEDGEERQVKMPEAMKEIAELHKKRMSLNSKNLPFYYRFKNITAEEFVTLLQTKKLRGVFSKLRKLACQGERRPFPARWKVKMVLRNKEIFAHVNEQLGLNRLVGLDYDARILENRDHRGIKLSELHTSSIVARRWNQKRNTCEYLIRDSHGVQCSRYDTRYECEQGNVWLGESEIYGSMTSIVFILGNPVP